MLEILDLLKQSRIHEMSLDETNCVKFSICKYCLIGVYDFVQAM